MVEHKGKANKYTDYMNSQNKINFEDKVVQLLEGIEESLNDISDILEGTHKMLKEAHRL